MLPRSPKRGGQSTVDKAVTLLGWAVFSVGAVWGAVGFEVRDWWKLLLCVTVGLGLVAYGSR